MPMRLLIYIYTEAEEKNYNSNVNKRIYTTNL